jgi:hypothetical protein
MSTYSFQDVVATLVGTGASINIGAGSANSEEGITIAHAGEDNRMTIGADGEGMHSLRADRSGQVTVRLLKTSPVNAALMALRNAQKAGGAVAGWGLNTITLVNIGSSDNWTCERCAFKKVPDGRYAAEGDVLEWTFDAVKIFPTLGVYL